MLRDNYPDNSYAVINHPSRNRSYRIDDFRQFNDMGDLLLRQAAQRLNACVCGGDTVARLGGDEFVVMLTGLDGAAAEAARQVEAVGNKILHELSRTYRLKQLSHRSTSSIGATLFLGGQSSIDDLLKQADLAMYKSKAVGRNALRSRPTCATPCRAASSCCTTSRRSTSTAA